MHLSYNSTTHNKARVNSQHSRETEKHVRTPRRATHSCLRAKFKKYGRTKQAVCDVTSYGAKEDVICIPSNYERHAANIDLQGGSNMTGTCAACLHTNQAQSYLNHLVEYLLIILFRQDNTSNKTHVL